MSESMVERVARAIFEKWAESEKSETTWDELLRMQSLDGYKHAKGVYRLAMVEARAAIDAMREPTDAMLYHMDGYSDLVGPYPEANTKEERLKEFSCAYRAAIDAALNEQVAE